MSHKTFVAVVIGLIVIAVVAMLILTQSRQSTMVAPESPVSEDYDNTVTPGEPEEASEPTPGTAVQGKINVQVACESALMYTTFTDGAAADAFVAECVEGKHPDVIERYIESLGVDGAAI